MSEHTDEKDTTKCGETYEHDQHIFYSKRRGYVICDGALWSKKRHESDCVIPPEETQP